MVTPQPEKGQYNEPNRTPSRSRNSGSPRQVHPTIRMHYAERPPKCSCGQTYGTCRRHLTEPEITSYLIIRTDGLEWATWAKRPKGMLDDQAWQDAQLGIAERIAETLIEKFEKPASPVLDEVT